MGKLIKYELKKQMLSKIIVGVVAAISQVIFFVGLLIDNPDWSASGIGILSILGFAAMFYFSFETIVTYSNDLKTKQSYMLFLIPRNMYQVVGAKMITTFLQILLVGAAFVAIFVVDVFAISAKKGEIKEMIEMIKMIFEQIAGIPLNTTEIIYIVSAVLVVWVEFVLMCMLAITLSTTLFANKRYKGVISFGIYVVLQILLEKVADYVTKNMMSSETLGLNADSWIYMGIYAVAMVLCYFGTTWLLDKRISV
ncbi:MAG: hypothetical protein IKL22_12535 [Lachnospiraceae bacterium]|nr:hypothetical protein [Lachnospiraceae bacterium]